MRYIPLFAALALAFPAQAQTESVSSANAGNSTQVLVQNGTTLQPASTSVHHSGSVEGTPSAPTTIVSGANNCLIATGGSIAGGPIALSFGQGKEDKGCSAVRYAAALKGLGQSHAAIALLCQDTAVADAFYAANGLACPGTNRKRYRNAEYAVIKP